jgi:hypothetical protein
MADGIQGSKSSLLTPHSSIAQPDFSQTLIAQGKAVAKDSLVASAPKAQPVKAVPVKKPVFYQGGDVIYQLGKYRITAAPTGSDTALDVYVNGKKHTIDVDTTKGKLFVGQTIARIVEEGKRFKNDALSWGEQADGSLTKTSNDRVYISAFNEAFAPHILSPIIQPFQGKTVFADIENSNKLIERLGYAAAARGKSFQEITVNTHGGPDGDILVGTDRLHASNMVKRLVDSGALKKGGTIEFFSCSVGQDFTGIREAAKKYGVNIKAANYFRNMLGVVGDGNIMNKPMEAVLSNTISSQDKVPVKPGVLTFTPSGKVFESDGTQITEIKYRRKK